MSHNITVTFLGTTSGGGPSETRNCSSLVIDPVPDGSLWMIDCAEGTVRQFAQQPFHDARRVKIGRLNKIFVTHLHADHTMGLLTILRNVLGIPKPTGPSPSTPTARPQVDIYGPRGLRHLLRTLFTMTHTHTDHRYAVHELLFSGEEPSAPATFVQGEEGPCESEANGQDLRCDADGFWRGIVDVQKVGKGSVIVDAGPIEHRDPCIGYVIREAPLNPSPHTPIPRKIVILGDTHDPSAMIPLIQSSRLPSPSSSADTPPPEPSTPVTLLIHEATDAYIPPSVDPQQRTGRNRTVQSVEAKMLERGHSTPAMAGAFARQIGAEKLVLNHIGARFSAPAHPAHAPQEKFRLACMREIERQATEAWEPPHNTHAQAAWDFLRVVLLPNPPRYTLAPPSLEAFASVFTEVDVELEVDVDMGGVHASGSMISSTQIHEQEWRMTEEDHEAARKRHRSSTTEWPERGRNNGGPANRSWRGSGRGGWRGRGRGGGKGWVPNDRRENLY